MKWQIKHIETKPILEFLLMLEQGKITHCYNNGCGLEFFRPSSATLIKGFAHSVVNAIDYSGHEGRSFHAPNMVRAKMKRLIQRGLVEGCACGCRGDFKLSEKGRSTLEATHE